MMRHPFNSTICVGSGPSVQQGIEISFDVDEETPIDYVETRVSHIPHDGAGAGDAVYIRFEHSGECLRPPEVVLTVERPLHVQSGYMFTVPCV